MTAQGTADAQRRQHGQRLPDLRGLESQSDFDIFNVPYTVELSFQARGRAITDLLVTGSDKEIGQRGGPPQALAAPRGGTAEDRVSLTLVGSPDRPVWENRSGVSPSTAQG